MLQQQSIQQIQRKSQFHPQSDDLQNMETQEKQIRQIFDSADYFITKYTEENAIRKQIQEEEQKIKNIQEAEDLQNQEATKKYVSAKKLPIKKSILKFTKQKKYQFDSAEYFIEQQKSKNKQKHYNNQELQQINEQNENNIDLCVKQQSEKCENQNLLLKQSGITNKNTLLKHNIQNNQKQNLDNKKFDSVEYHIQQNQKIQNEKSEISEIEQEILKQSDKCEIKNLLLSKNCNNNNKKKQQFDSADYWLEQYKNTSNQQESCQNINNSEYNKDFKNYHLNSQEQKKQKFDSADYFMKIQKQKKDFQKN